MAHNIMQLVIFYHVLDLKSFSKAAARLNLSKAHVSRQISQLEKSMQTKLLERTTRRLAPTVAGEQLFQHSRKIVLESERAAQTIASLQEKPAGLLRITTPPAFAAFVLSKHLPEFLASYPDIQLDMRLTSDVVDLMDEKIDVAIRSTHTPPDDRIAKLIGHYQLDVLAGTKYFEHHSIPKYPHELTQHSCITCNGSAWPFMINGQPEPVNIQPRLTSNTYQAMLGLALAGSGITRLPSYVIKDEVAAGKVQLLFTEFMPPEIPIYAVYAPDPHLPPRIKVFIEFLLRSINILN